MTTRLKRATEIIPFLKGFVLAGFMFAPMLLAAGSANAGVSAMKRGPQSVNETDKQPVEFAAPAPETYHQPRYFAANAKMDLFFGGIRLGEFDLSSQVDGDRYRTQGTVALSGIASMIVDGEAFAYSEGRIVEGKVKPARFGATTPGDDENGTHVVTVDYGEGADFSFESSVPLKGEAARKSLAQDALDPLILGLGIPVLSGKKGLCDFTLPGFEGTHRFDMEFSNPRPVMISGSRYTPYEGAALACDITLKPLQRVEDDGTVSDISDEDNSKLTLTLGLVEAPDGGSDLLIPVKLEMKFMMGALVAHTTDWQVRDPRKQETANR